MTAMTAIRSVDAARKPSSGVFPWRDALTIGIVLAVALPVIASIDNAKWVDGLPSLYPMAFFGIAVGYAFARIPWRAAFVFPAALLAGATGLLLQVLAVTPGDNLRDRSEQMVLRMRLWSDALRGGGISNDNLPVIILFLVLTWLVTFYLAWSVFRWHNAWSGLVPAGLALLMNVSYLPGQNSPAFIVFVIAAVLLIARTRLDADMEFWRHTSTEYPGPLHFFALNQTVWATLILVGAAWLIPVAGEAGPLPSMWRSATNPVADRFVGFGRVFSAIEGGKRMPLDRYASFLPYRGYFGAVEGTIMTVRSSKPVLLRAAVYDVYTAGGWKSGDRDKEALDRDSGDVASSLARAEEQYRQPLAIEVTVEQSLPVFVAPGEPFIVDREANVETGGDASNVTALRPSERLRAGDTYVAVGLVSTASDDALGRSGSDPAEWYRTTLDRESPDPYASLRGDYPEWVKERYLQLPDDLPSSISQLAESLTDEFNLGDMSAYGKAGLIQEYLRTFPVELSEQPPPSDTDAVSYFLFERQRGHPLYHASAMVVLLRTLGIPARLAVGFALPERSGGEEVYKIDSSNAYAWPEVYFVGLGWIPFNPARTSGTRDLPMSPEETWGSYPADTISTQDILDMLPAGAERGVTPDQQGSPPPASETGGGALSAWLIAGLALLGLAGLVVIGGFRLRWNRGLKDLSHPAQVFEKTRRLASWAGIGPRPSQTPREFLLELRDELPDGPDTSPLLDAYERVEFGRKTLGREDDNGLDALWGGLRARLLRRILRRR